MVIARLPGDRFETWLDSQTVGRRVCAHLTQMRLHAGFVTAWLVSYVCHPCAILVFDPKATQGRGEHLRRMASDGTAIH